MHKQTISTMLPRRYGHCPDSLGVSGNRMTASMKITPHRSNVHTSEYFPFALSAQRLFRMHHCISRAIKSISAQHPCRTPSPPPPETARVFLMYLYVQGAPGNNRSNSPAKADRDVIRGYPHVLKQRRWACFLAGTTPHPSSRLRKGRHHSQGDQRAASRHPKQRAPSVSPSVPR